MIFLIFQISNSNQDDTKKNYIFPRVWINDDYNKNELPPTEDNTPLKVNVSIYLSSIIKIRDTTQVIQVTIFNKIISFIKPGFKVISN